LDRAAAETAKDLSSTSKPGADFFKAVYRNRILSLLERVHAARFQLLTHRSEIGQ
jgi:hypothetical protein